VPRGQRQGSLRAYCGFSRLLLEQLNFGGTYRLNLQGDLQLNVLFNVLASQRTELLTIAVRTSPSYKKCGATSAVKLEITALSAPVYKPHLCILLTGNAL
jgi:hypothetical protein